MYENYAFMWEISGKRDAKWKRENAVTTFLHASRKIYCARRHFINAWTRVSELRDRPPARFNNFLTGVNFRARKLHLVADDLLGRFQIYESSVNSDKVCNVTHSRTRSLIETYLECCAAVRIKFPFFLFISFIYKNNFSSADGCSKNDAKQKQFVSYNSHKYFFDYWIFASYLKLFFSQSK